MSDHSITIEAGQPTAGIAAEAWEHRELLLLLAWRDIAVRYKQTVLGLAWGLLRPLLTTLVFVVVFAFVVKAPSPDAPYALLVLAGLLAWQLVAGIVAAATESLLGNASMLSKVYFPRMLFPLSATAVPLADFAAGLVLFGCVMAWYGVVPTWRIAFLPAVLALAICLAVGAGLWLSAAAVRYRDLRHVVPFFLQIGLYVSPVAYPSALVPEPWQLLYALNPAVGLIDGFRWTLLGAPFLNLPALAFSAAGAALLMLLGLAYFRRVEQDLVDIL